MSKHTPGPWSWSEDMAVDTPGEVARTVDAPAEAVLYHNAGWDVKAADRALIAAAPDFYREAVRVVEWLDRIADAADERARTCGYPSLAEANAADAKNYRASAKGLRAAISKAESR
jgi:hypothetical protein